MKCYCVFKLVVILQAMVSLILAGKASGDRPVQAAGQAVKIQSTSSSVIINDKSKETEQLKAITRPWSIPKHIGKAVRNFKDERFRKGESEFKTIFTLFSRDKPEGEIISVDNLGNMKNTSPSKPLKFVVNGYVYNDNPDWALEMVTASLTREDCNVITVDWGEAEYGYASHYRKSLWTIIGKVTHCIRDLIKKLIKEGNISASNIYLIWDSSGAHTDAHLLLQQPAVDNMEDSTFVKNPQYQDKSYKTSLFSGQVTHTRMLSICDQIDREGRHFLTKNFENFEGSIFLENLEHDDIFEENSTGYLDSIFGSLSVQQRLMWTGCFGRWMLDSTENSGSWEFKCSNRDDFKNFCSKTGWEADLKKLQDSTEKTDNIFVVKDFGNPNTACKKFFNSKQLIDIMGQSPETIPELSFMCASAKNLTIIFDQQNSIPALIRMKVESGNFLIYGVSATLENALRECENQDHQLVTINSLSKLREVENVLKMNSNYYTTDDMFWTGGYMNVSINSTPSSRIFEWYGSPTTITAYSTELFPNFSSAELDQAVDNLIKSISRCKNKGRSGKDCAGRLHVGLHHPKTSDDKGYSKGLTILNSYGNFLNQDTHYFYVICEKKGRI